MIRNNDATELCITKWQEGHVVGWKLAIGSRGQFVLETLYVKLDRPTKNINIEGLPENVVPLMKIKDQSSVHFQMVFLFLFVDHKFRFYQILQ